MGLTSAFAGCTLPLWSDWGQLLGASRRGNTPWFCPYHRKFQISLKQSESFWCVKKTHYPWIEIIENDFPIWSPRALSSFLPFQAFPFFKKKFFCLFWCGPFKKSFLNLLQYCFCLYVLVFWPGGMWDPSSLTWDQTCTPYIERWSLDHWAPREVLPSFPWWFLSSSPNSSDPGPSHREDPCLGVWQWALGCLPGTKPAQGGQCHLGPHKSPARWDHQDNMDEEGKEGRDSLKPRIHRLYPSHFPWVFNPPIVLMTPDFFWGEVSPEAVVGEIRQVLGVTCGSAPWLLHPHTN